MLEREPGRYLITQRQKAASLPLLWEFPGGRVNEGEGDEQALTRELKERLGLDVIVDEAAGSTRHEYPSYDVDFCVFTAGSRTRGRTSATRRCSSPPATPSGDRSPSRG
ncbi:MAG: hypothetical protein AMXMBFR34_46280 [Myxococcaceae bacterium]